MNIERFVRTTGFFLPGTFAMCLGLSSLSAAQNKPAVLSSPQKLQLEPCRLPGWNEDVRCGSYSVFEDRQARAGRRITLKIVVVPSLSERPAPDPVFYFSGGPGGSAVDTVTRAGKPYLAGLRQDRDLVFVDQRGTGTSNPLPCNLYGDRNDITNFVGELFSLEKLRACRAELEKSADLKLYSTPMAMEDLDEIRAALGYDRINLYGGSYGSTAAMVYLRQFPQHVRTATLLGVVAPEHSLPLPFAKGVQNALDRLFADCAADDKCRSAFADLKSDLNAALKLLDKGPASVDAVNPFTRKVQHITLTRAAFVEFVRTLLYTQDGARWLPLMTHQAAEGEFGLLVTLGFQVFRGIDDQIARGMHFSVVCGEDIPFVTDEEAKREMTGSFYGEGRLRAYRQACEIWPRASVPGGFRSPVKSDAPVLLISGEADPVAPPWLAEAATHQLSNGRHVVVPHTGHSFGYPCVDAMVVAFVTKGTARELDVSCLSQVRRPPFVTEEMLTAMARSQITRENTPAGAEQEVWQGVLEMGQARLRLVLRLSRTVDGKLTGKVDSPDQNASGLPVSAITFTEKSLRFEMDIIGAVYEGKLNGDGSEITGQWKQGGNSWPLDLKRAAK